MGMKKTEIGMIPEDWDVQRFSDTFRILNNNTYSRAELNYASGQFRNIHYGDVLILFPEVLDCIREDVPYINDEVRISGSAQPLQDGDVVMADTAEDETVGKVTEVTNTSDKPVMAGLHTIPCRVKFGEFVPKWLGYYMNSHLYHDQLLPYIHGTKVSSVSKGSLGDTVIIVPKAPEQKRIVDALSDVDALIVDLQKLIRKKKDILQGAMQMLVTGKKRLPGYYADFEHFTIGELGSLAKMSINPCQEPKTIFDEYSMPAFDDGAKPQQMLGELMLSSRIKLTPNTLLFNKLNVRQRRVWLVKDCSNNSVCSSEFLPYKSEKIDLSFLKQLLLTDKVTKDFEDMSSGTSNSQQRITPSDFLKYEISIPSLEEQRKIALILFDMDTEIQRLEEKLSKYQKVKQGMMEELLTGKVRLM